DPSDIVQEAFADAGRRLPEYLRDRPVGFFPWLLGLATQRLIGSRRLHLGSGKRSVAKETARDGVPSDLLIDRLAGSDTSPSGRAIRDEERAGMRAAVSELG